MSKSRIAILSFFAVVLVALAPPAQAYSFPDFLAQWFPAIFGSKDTDPRPAQTLQAPFAAPEENAGGKNEFGIEYGEAVPGLEASTLLSRPHRHQEQIADWLVNAASEILSVDADAYDRHLQWLATGMDKAALNDFKNFMNASNILDALKSNKLKLHSFIEGAPLLLNQGAVDGRYRWLFEMPVTMTFLPRDASYEGATPINQHIIVTMQVGRVPAGQGVDELMIEMFAVRKNPNAGKE